MARPTAFGHPDRGVLLTIDLSGVLQAAAVVINHTQPNTYAAHPVSSRENGLKIMALSTSRDNA
jgi:hypothetical protein